MYLGGSCYRGVAAAILRYRARLLDAGTLGIFVGIQERLRCDGLHVLSRLIGSGGVGEKGFGDR